MFPRAYLGTVIRWDPGSRQLEQCNLTKDHHGCWQLQTIASLSLLGTPYPHVLTLDTIYNAGSGQYDPFVLRTASSKTTDGDVVLSRWSISTRSCHDVAEAVNTRIARGSIACCIASGPIVICFTTSALYVVLPKPGTVEPLILSSKQLRLMSQAVAPNRSNSTSRGCDGQRFAIDCVWSFDWTGREMVESGSLATVLLVVKCLNCSASITPDASFLASLLVSLSGKGLHCHPSPQEAVIPQEYATAMMTPQFILGTSYNQLVVIEDGSILHCIDVGASPSQVIAVQLSGERMGIACQINKEENDEDRVVTYKLSSQQQWERKEWDGVREMVEGDFMGLGHKQLLFFLNTPGDFAITDFNTIQFNSKEAVRGGLAATAGVSDALKTALSALQVRKLRGEAQLDSTRRELQRKQDLFSSGLQLLTQLGVGNRKSPPPLPPPAPANFCDQLLLVSYQSLICLIPGKPEPKHSVAGTKLDRSASPLHLCAHWQRVVDNRWVVGIWAKNVSSNAIQCLSLSLSLTGSSDGPQLPISSQSRMVLVTPPGAGDCDDFSVATSSEPVFQPPIKKIRMEKRKEEGEGREEMEEVNTLAVNNISPLDALRGALLASQAMACVVVSAPLPSFSSSSVDAAVIASWCEREGGRGGGGGESDIVRSTELCHVVLSAEDICSEKFKCSSDCLSLWTGTPFLPSCGPGRVLSDWYKDLACLVGSREVAKVIVSSAHTNLLCLPTMLRARLPQSVVTLSGDVPHPPSTTASFQPSPLTGCVLHCHCEPHKATLSIMHSSCQQLSLLLQLISSSLPHDIYWEKERYDLAALASGLKTLRERLTNMLAE